MRAIIIAIILTAFTAFACNKVADPTIKVNRQKAEATKSCQSECAHVMVDARHAENATHKANVEACAGDTTCLRIENQRHVEATHSISAAHKACVKECK